MAVPSCWNRGRRRRCLGSLLSGVDDADHGSSVVEDFEDGDRVGMRDQRALREAGAEATLDFLDLGSVAETMSGKRVVRVALARLRVNGQTAGAVDLGEKRDPAFAG